MIKTHVEILARIIKDSIDSVDKHDHRALEQSKYIAIALCCELAKTNPQFDETRFLKACGLDIE